MACRLRVKGISSLQLTDRLNSVRLWTVEAGWLCVMSATPPPPVLLHLGTGSGTDNEQGCKQITPLPTTNPHA